MTPYAEIGLISLIYDADTLRLARDDRGPGPEGGLTEQTRQMQDKAGRTEACDGFQTYVTPAGNTVTF